MCCKRGFFGETAPSAPSQEEEVGTSRSRPRIPGVVSAYWSGPRKPLWGVPPQEAIVFRRLPDGSLRFEDP